MKILFVITSLQNGGAERVCVTLANHLSKNNDVSILKHDKNEPFYKLNSNIKLINPHVFKSAFMRRIKKISDLRSLIKREKYDVVVSFMDSTNFLVILAMLGLKTKLIISEHTSYNAPKPFWVKPLKWLLYPFANALSVLSKVDLNYYKKINKNTIIMHNPSFVNQCEWGTDKQNLVLFVGRLTSVKNPQMFIHVANELKALDAEFVMIGDGVMKDELIALNQSLNAGVKMIGSVADVSSWYKRAKILVSTSNFEGFGNTLIEAMAFDCVRISTKTSGACEIIDDDGILIDFNDVKQMSEAIKMVLNDDVKRQNLLKNARKNYDKFNTENIAKKWLEIMK
ncbi:glycosyltransferase [Campylobacter majalis]|uniref:glycosyltransferase n=1 Tax=Campylobacter majalis TaxID=2790656 RepID=UPI003D6969D3